MKPPIVILTDFGTSDPFVGIMKGVILGISPDTPIIDLTHEIPPGDIFRGAITLWNSINYFPEGTLFLTVVDPGVGTQRLPIILETSGYTFIGPDNGVFSFVLGPSYQSWELSNPKFTLPTPWATFHGRDIFAPASAHASLGVEGSEFGGIVSEIQTLPYPHLRILSNVEIIGEILYADRFGNTLTSLGIINLVPGGSYQLSPWSGGKSTTPFDIKNGILRIPGGHKLSWASTYGEIPEGVCAMILGSSGLLEIAANRQSAVKLLNLNTGDPVTLELPTLNI